MVAPEMPVIISLNKATAFLREFGMRSANKNANGPFLGLDEIKLYAGEFITIIKIKTPYVKQVSV